MNRKLLNILLTISTIVLFALWQHSEQRGIATLQQETPAKQTVPTPATQVATPELRKSQSKDKEKDLPASTITNATATVEGNCSAGNGTCVQTATTPGVWQWVEARTETFALDAGQKAAFGPLNGSNADHPLAPHLLRYDINASMPIDTGALDDLFIGNGKNNDDFSNSFGSPVTLCFTPKTLASRHTCRLTGETRQGYVLVRDARSNTPQSNATAVAGALLGVKEPLQRQAAENRITLTMYEWRFGAINPIP